MKNKDGLHITTNVDKRRKYPYKVAFDPIESDPIEDGKVFRHRGLNESAVDKIKNKLTRWDVQVKCINHGFVWFYFKSETDVKEFTTYLQTLKREDWDS